MRTLTPTMSTPPTTEEPKHIAHRPSLMGFVLRGTASLLLIAGSAFAQLDTTATTDTAQSIDAATVAPEVVKPRSDSLRVTPAPVVAPARQAAPKIKLVKHSFVYREQVVMAVCMMIFIVLMINTTQALNPD